MHREERGAGQVGFSEKDFKVCDLCGALNRVSNNQCFVCSWNGMFHQEEEVVRRAMKEFEQRYGGLSDTMLAEELLPDEQSVPGFFSAVIGKIKQFLGGRGSA